MKTGRMLRMIAGALLLSMLWGTFFPLGSAFSQTVTAEETTEQGQTISSELPVVSITTESGKAVTTKEYERAELQISAPAEFEGYANPYTEAGGGIDIRCRGNSTFDDSENRLGKSGKYSYKIKLDVKSDLLGLGASRHFALIANYYDVTSLRNKLVYDLAARMGLSSTGSRFVVVYLNGSYRGLYTLCETVRIAGNRVDIQDFEDIAEDAAEAIAKAEGLDRAAGEKLSDAMKSNLGWITSGHYKEYRLSDYGIDVSAIDRTSGYLIELDYRMDGQTTKFYTENGIPIQLDSPKALETNPEMLSYLKNLLSDFEEAIFSPTYCTSDGRHYSEFVDVDSMVDYFLIFHLFKNIEFGFLSIYFYVEDGKIVFGPCWDFDGSSGNQVTLTKEWMPADRWFYMNRGPWFLKLCSDPYFVNCVEERWFAISDLVEGMMDELELANDTIAEEGERNFALYGAPKNWYIPNSACKGYEPEVLNLRNWLRQRINWLNVKLAERNPDIEGLGADSSDRMSLKLSYGSTRALALDRQPVAGAPCDYLLSPDQADKLVLTITTEHTSHRFAEVYVNGKFVGRTELTQKNPAKIKIGSEFLELDEGKVQIVRVVGINEAGDYYRSDYLRVRATEIGNPSSKEAILTVGSKRTIEKLGSTVTLPDIDEQPGWKAVGWTDGNDVYPAGSEYTVEKSANLYVRWKLTDLNFDRTPLRQVEDNPSLSPSPEPTAPEQTEQPPSGTKTGVLVAVAAGTVGIVIAAAAVLILVLRRKKRPSA